MAESVRSAFTECECLTAWALVGSRLTGAWILFEAKTSVGEEIIYE